MSTRLFLLIAIAISVFAFGIATIRAQSASLTHAEAYTVWVIFYDSIQETGQAKTQLSMRDYLSILRDDYLQVVTRMRKDGFYQSLYFFSLNTWSLITGESEIALRLYSILWGSIALASIFQLGKFVFNRHIGLLAGSLCVASLFGFYANHVQLHSQLFALFTLSLWVYALWWQNRTRRLLVLLGIILALLCLTHLVGIFVVLVLGMFSIVANQSVIQQRLGSIKVRFNTPIRRRVWLLVGSLTIFMGVALRPPVATDWRTVVQNVADLRQNHEPAIVNYPPFHPIAYYDRLYHLRQGITIDLGWRVFSNDELQITIQALQQNSSIWLISLGDMPLTTQISTILTTNDDQNRAIGYRLEIDNVIVYRFDVTNVKVSKRI